MHDPIWNLGMVVVSTIWDYLNQDQGDRDENEKDSVHTVHSVRGDAHRI